MVPDPPQKKGFMSKNKLFDNVTKEHLMELRVKDLRQYLEAKRIPTAGKHVHDGAYGVGAPLYFPVIILCHLVSEHNW